MAYYLGRQVNVFITTEQTGAAVTVSGAGNGPYIDVIGIADTFTRTCTGSYQAIPTITVSGGNGTAMAMTALTGAADGGGFAPVTGVNITNYGTGYTTAPTLIFSSGSDGDVSDPTRASGTISVTKGRDSYTLFADGLHWGTQGSAPVSDLTGVDLSIGAVDEDISYMGLRSITKAEIKKETTLTLTRKKSDAVWDTIYNANWRCGINGTSSAYENLEEPAVGKGYRVYVTLVSGTEVITLPNACISAHTTSLNVDGTDEETLEFYTYVTPLITTTNAAATGATAATDL